MNHDLFELHNDCPDPLRVWIEPWGQELFIHPGMTWRLVGSQHLHPKVAVTYQRSSLSIHVSPEASIKWMEGERLVWES